MMQSESIPAAGSPAVANAGRAGVLATLVMLAVQLIWRLNWSHNGVVQAFPEFVVAAISRLTPLSIFGAATENYGSLAKKTLFTFVIFGIVGVGYRGGIAAGWLATRTQRGAIGRVIAGFVVAAALLLAVLVVVMPIAHLGFFAVDSGYTSDILTQLFVTFGLFGVVWAVLATPQLSDQPVSARTEPAVSRRNVLAQGVWGVGALAAVATVGVASWRLITPRVRRVNAANDGMTGVDIVATQRANQGNPLPPTSTPVSEVATIDVAALQADVFPQSVADPIAYFAGLDAKDHISAVLTETDDFYHVSKNLNDPTVDVSGWKLKVTGMVDTPLELGYEEVVAMATTQKITTLSCISNELNGSLTGTALWTGLPLKDLLDRAGAQAGAIDIVFHGADDYQDSIPFERGVDPDTTIVVSMNGLPLRDDHGYPARMIVPGIYGMKNVKWLQEIEVVGDDFMGYWQSRGWSDTAVSQIWGRIDKPGSKIDPGAYVATGLAGAGDRDISRVEVSLDDGENWADALLEPSLNPPFTWVRWAFEFDAQPGKYKMRMRATDGAGQVMLEHEQSPLPDGATGWPKRSFEVKG